MTPGQSLGALEMLLVEIYEIYNFLIGRPFNKEGGNALVPLPFQKAYRPARNSAYCSNLYEY